MNVASASSCNPAPVHRRSHDPDKQNASASGGAILGMESVVASTSGYAGADKLNLIRLINAAGAFYTRDLSKHNTHLVCWQFQGNKYAFARKSSMTIVNHQWFEDCLRTRSMLSITPYIMQSGEDVGPLKWKPPPATRERNVTKQSSNKDEHSSRVIPSEQPLSSNRKETITEVNAGASHPQPDRVNNVDDCHPRHGKRSLSKILCLSNGNGVHESLTESHQASSSNKHMTKNKDPAKKLKLRKISEYLRPVANGLQQNGTESTVSRNLEDDKQNLEDSTQVPENATKKREVNIGIQFLKTSRNRINRPQPKSSEPEKLGASSSNQNESPTSSTNDVSCPICLTDASASRAVLQCGHRFCYNCIQRWAKQRVQEKKGPTCPLCLKEFDFIGKMDSNDHKIYSQTVPEISEDNIRMVYGETGFANYLNPNQNLPCSICHNMHTEELILKCYYCRRRAVHTFCLDPPLPPVHDQQWICRSCTSQTRFFY